MMEGYDKVNPFEWGLTIDDMLLIYQLKAL